MPNEVTPAGAAEAVQAIAVELKPHIGKTDSGRVIKHPQCLVFANGKQVAIYCGKQKQEGETVTYEPGKYLSFNGTLYEVADELGRPYDEVLNEVAAGVGKEVGGVSKVGAPPAPWGEQIDLSNNSIIFGVDLG
jgi:hypothetical protein